ncbi:MAG: hypothetical protein ACOH1R_02195 [Luteimonas sp.]
MQRRMPWLLLAAILLVCALLGLRHCQREPASGTITTPASAVTGNASAGDTDVADAQDAKQRARIKHHDDALYAAVATLQRYLAALGSDERADADAFWANKRPPADSHEADLRTLENLRGMRIENGAPKALDSAAVPSALEIPVELRVSVEGKPMRRYRGWYRLRRAVVDGQWEITSASVDAVPRPE